jgi:prepilin-type N-terminal cleavage/methylation domain-containing protein
MDMKRGFTLIEILIVVAIIAILASVVLVGLGPTQQAGRDARRLSDLRNTQNALELYFNKCGYYPGAAQATSPCGAYSAAANWAALSTAITGSSIGVNTVPNDPSSGRQYYYGTDSTGSNYVVGAVLENSNNSVFVNYTAPNVSSYTDGDIGSAKGGSGAACAAPAYCLTL